MILSANAFSCTTFIISGKVTMDGKPILFKNRDTGEMQNSLVHFTDGKYKYIGLVNGNNAWSKEVWGGYNECGFAIMNSAAYNNNVGDTSKFTDQEGVIMKLALQKCKTLSDFEKLIEALPKPLGVDANFGVIDAFGGAAYYETGHWDFTKYDINDPSVAPKGFLVRTNHSMRSDLTKGYGFCRYNTAITSLSKAVAEKSTTPQLLFNAISRNLSHSLTNTDLWKDVPKERDVPDFRFFIDYIPRILTASAVMVVGAADKDHIKDAMMWTILGFPLTSVAIPTWITGGPNLPEAVAMDTNKHSPLCNAALKLKKECFPITYDGGRNYINLSVVINQQNTGSMQLLKPVENEIYNRTKVLMEGKRKGKKKEKEIQNFYHWIDQYLNESYMTLFNIELFEN
jgi:acyl-CoA:6-aminopenicillanic acid acyl transferase